MPLDQLHAVESDPSIADHITWSWTMWLADRGDASLFPSVHGATFARILSAMENVLAPLPIYQLLQWKHRILSAHMPTTEIQHGIPQPAARQREAILFWQQEVTEMLSHIIRPLRHVPHVVGVPILQNENGLEMIIFHMYSGRRRSGDCHAWLDHFMAEFFPQVKASIVSIDTAVHESLGNMSGSNFAMIRQIASKGAVTASIAGPPCETWSGARHAPIPEIPLHKQPRPLPSRTMPWCLPGLTQREMLQLRTGSRLMLHTWLTEIPIVLTGGAALKEHPSTHWNEEAPSVWATEAHRKWLMGMPGADLHEVEQWRYGSVAVKPTTLRVLHLGPTNCVRADLRTGQDHTLVKPSNPLQGIDREGKFKTAAAKEYPTNLARAMAFTLVHGLRERFRAEGWRFCSTALTPNESEWLRSALQSSAMVNRCTTWLPDFQL